MPASIRLPPNVPATFQPPSAAHPPFSHLPATPSQHHVPLGPSHLLSQLPPASQPAVICLFCMPATIRLPHTPLIPCPDYFPANTTTFQGASHLPPSHLPPATRLPAACHLPHLPSSPTAASRRLSPALPPASERASRGRGGAAGLLHPLPAALGVQAAHAPQRLLLHLSKGRHSWDDKSVTGQCPCQLFY